jgi:hypothetical protein
MPETTVPQACLDGSTFAHRVEGFLCKTRLIHSNLRDGIYITGAIIFLHHHTTLPQGDSHA